MHIQSHNMIISKLKLYTNFKILLKMLSLTIVHLRAQLRMFEVTLSQMNTPTHITVTTYNITALSNRKHHTYIIHASLAYGKHVTCRPHCTYQRTTVNLDFLPKTDTRKHPITFFYKEHNLICLRDWKVRE